MKKYSIIALILTWLAVTPVLAQTTSSTPTTETSASPTQSAATSSEPSASPSAEAVASQLQASFTTSSRSPLVWLRFRRFFTLNKLKRSELTLAIANTLLTQAQEQQAAGNVTQSSATLDKFTREMDILQAVVTTIQASSTNQTVNTFLDKVLADKTEQLTLLEAAKPQNTSELATKLINLRAKTVRDIIRILEKPDLTDAERAKKLAHIMDKYTAHETRIDAKITKKLDLASDLDASTTKTEVETEIENEEDEAVADAAKLEDDALESVTAHLDDDNDNHSLVVLQKLLLKVPDAAKSGIETALNAKLRRHLNKFEDNSQQLETFIQQLGEDNEAEKKILDRLKEKGNSEVKLRLEENKKRLEKTKKEVEAKREQKQETEKKVVSTATPKSATATPRAESSGTSAATSTPQVEKTAIDVEIEGGQFKTITYKVKKGSLLTVRFRYRDSDNVNLRLSNGAQSPYIGRDEETTVTPFVITGPTTFTSPGATNLGTINVE